MHFDNVERATGNPDDGVRLRIAAVASTTCSLGLCLTAGALDVHPHLQPIRRRCSSSSSSEHGWRLGYSRQAGLDESFAEHGHRTEAWRYRPWGKDGAGEEGATATSIKRSEPTRRSSQRWTEVASSVMELQLHEPVDYDRVS